MRIRYFEWVYGGLLLLLLPGCEEFKKALVPSGATACSSTSPCQDPAMTCNLDTSTCVPGGADLSMTGDLLGPGQPDLAQPDLVPPRDLMPECVKEADCGGGAFCSGGVCAPCTQHADCTSAVCDLYQSSPRGPGKCVAASTLVYVDNKNGGACVSGDGSQANPVCTMMAGLGKLDATRKAIRVMPSSKNYGAVGLADQTVVIYGPAGEGGKGAQFSGDLTNNAVTVSGASDVTIDGVDTTLGPSGVGCSGGAAKLSVRRSQIANASAVAAGVGMDINGCTLTLDRVRLIGNKDGALNMVKTTYAITNCFFVGNSSAVNPAILISNNSTGTFRFNTVGGNVSAVPAGIDCGQVGRNIEDSIFIGNSSIGGTQLSGQCTLVTTVVGKNDSAAGTKLDPDFVKPAAPSYDYSLKDSAANAACCIDKATGKVATDYFGTRRPLGAGYDIGAHEAK